MKKKWIKIGSKKKDRREREELTEERFYDEDKGRKVVCTCRQDPAWCEKHGGF